MKISRKHTHEWVTAAESDKASGELLLYLKKQWFTMTAGLLVILFAVPTLFKLLGFMWAVFPLVFGDFRFTLLLTK